MQSKWELLRIVDCVRSVAATTSSTFSSRDVGKKTMTDPLRFVTLFVVCLVHFVSGDAAGSFRIGAMLSSQRIETVFLDAVNDVNAPNASFVLNASSSVLSANPFRSALDVCENVISQGVYAVIVSQAAGSASPPVAVSFACGFYRIPIIGIRTRESVFSNKRIHHSFLRTVPPYSDQAHVWLGLLTRFQWNKVILLTSNDQDSRAIATKFTELAEQKEIKIEKTIVFPTGIENATSHLKILLKTQSRVILFSASEQDAAVVFQNAVHLRETGEGFAWLVTEQTLSGKARKVLPQGVLGIKLMHADNETAQLRDAVKIAAKALGRLNTTGGIAPPVTSCNETGYWKSGDAVFSELISTMLPDGETGEVQFDNKGDRLNATYQIVNLKASGDKKLTVVGGFKNGLVTLNNNITWPGNQTKIPEGVFISNHLKVVTVVGEPFVFIRDVPANGKCESLDTDTRQHIKCTGEVFGEDIDKAAKTRKEHCCYGFCIALLIKLGKTVNFTYSVHLAEDGSYGSLRRVNDSDIKRWNGMVGEVMDGKADLIVAALTINNERAEWIEFSKPFKYQGLTILVKKDKIDNSLDSFLRPFQINLWLLVLLSVHVVAVILYLLDRFSPFGRFKLARKEQEETALNLSSAMWFSWGVLLNSGIGEGTPRSFSARVLGMVWAGFAMIIVASYTANLAAFLVLDRPKAVVSGLDDPNLRNPSDDFTYATVANSSVDAYFRGQVEMSSMYTFMEKYNVKTAKDAIEKVKRGDLKAFIWDSPVLYYEASKDCRLTTAGELFSRSGYGIGMPKGSIWSNNISLAILNFHESGVMEELETAWIDTNKCEEESTSPATLGLEHMLGVFIMVAAGIGAGIVIILLEIVYHKHRGWKERQKEIAKKTTDKWRANIMFKKKDRSQPNGDLETNGRSDAIARRNPIFTPDPLAESAFTYN